MAGPGRTLERLVQFMVLAGTSRRLDYLAGAMAQLKGESGLSLTPFCAGYIFLPRAILKLLCHSFASS